MSKPSNPNGNINNTKSFALPQEVYDALFELSSELNFKHRGAVSLVPMLEAFSQIEPEAAYDFFREHGLLPKSGTDAQYKRICYFTK